MSQQRQVDIAGLQRQQDDRIAELVSLHEAGLLSAEDLEHAIQKQREVFQQKLVTLLDNADNRDTASGADRAVAGGGGGGAAAGGRERPRGRHRRTRSGRRRLDAQGKLLAALKDAQESGQWNTLEDAIDEALNAGLPHTNASVIAAFNFIENQLVEPKPGARQRAQQPHPHAAADADADAGGDAAAENFDPSGTLRQMLQDNLLSPEEYAQAIKKLGEEQKQGEASASASASGANQTPTRSTALSSPTPPAAPATLEQMFDEITSMYRKGHISSPDFARASHLLAHEDEGLTDSERKEKHILVEMLKAPPRPIIIHDQQTPERGGTGDPAARHSPAVAAVAPVPHPKPSQPSPAGKSAAEDVLSRRVQDARAGRLSPDSLKRAISVAEQALEPQHPLVQEANSTWRRLQRAGASPDAGDDEQVSVKAVQQALCGLFAAADFDSHGSIPVDRLVQLAAIRCPRDGRRWKLTRCLQQIQLHIPSAAGAANPAQRPQHPGERHQVSPGRSVQMLRDDAEDNDGAARAPGVGPVEFVLYLTHRWHGGMHNFTPSEFEETMLLMHQVVEQLRLQRAADAATKADDVESAMSRRWKPRHAPDTTRDKRPAERPARERRRRGRVPPSESRGRRPRRSPPRDDGKMSPNLQHLLQVHGLAEHAPTMAALGLLHPADCVDLNVDEMIECIPALTIPQVRALYKLAAACRARSRRDRERDADEYDDLSTQNYEVGDRASSPPPAPVLSPRPSHRSWSPQHRSRRSPSPISAGSPDDETASRRHSPGHPEAPVGHNREPTGGSHASPPPQQPSHKWSPRSDDAALRIPPRRLGPVLDGGRSSVQRKSAKQHQTPSAYPSSAPYTRRSQGSPPAASRDLRGPGPQRSSNGNGSKPNDSTALTRTANTTPPRSEGRGHSSPGDPLRKSVTVDDVPTESPYYRSSAPAPAWLDPEVPADQRLTPFRGSHQQPTSGGGRDSVTSYPRARHELPSQRLTYPHESMHHSGALNSPDRQRSVAPRTGTDLAAVDSSQGIMDRALRTELQNVVLRLQAVVRGHLTRAEAKKLSDSVDKIEANARRFLESRSEASQLANEAAYGIPQRSISTTARGAYGRRASPPPDLRGQHHNGTRSRNTPSPPPQRSVEPLSSRSPPRNPELQESLGDLLSSIRDTITRLGANGEQRPTIDDDLDGGSDNGLHKSGEALTTTDLAVPDFESAASEDEDAVGRLADRLQEILGSEPNEPLRLQQQPEQRELFPPNDGESDPSLKLSSDVAVPYVRPSYIAQLEQAGYGSNPVSVPTTSVSHAPFNTARPQTQQPQRTPSKKHAIAERIAARRLKMLPEQTPAAPGTPDLAATGGPGSGPGSRGFKSPELPPPRQENKKRASVHEMVDDILNSDDSTATSLTSDDSDDSSSDSDDSDSGSEDSQFRRKFKRQEKRLSLTKLKQVGRRISPKRNQIRQKAKRLEEEQEGNDSEGDDDGHRSRRKSKRVPPVDTTVGEDLEEQLGSEKFAIAPSTKDGEHKVFYLQYRCKNLDGCTVYSEPSYQQPLPRKPENTVAIDEIITAAEETPGWLKIMPDRWVPKVSIGGTTVNFVAVHEDEDAKEDFESAAVQAVRQRAKTVENAIEEAVQKDEEVGFCSVAEQCEVALVSRGWLCRHGSKTSIGQKWLISSIVKKRRKWSWTWRHCTTSWQWPSAEVRRRRFPRPEDKSTIWRNRSQSTRRHTNKRRRKHSNFSSEKSLSRKHKSTQCKSLTKRSKKNCIVSRQKRPTSAGSKKRLANATKGPLTKSG